MMPFRPYTRPIHRTLATVLGLFILSHLAVHLAAMGGIEAHQRWLKFVQVAYRNPVGEILLVLAVVVQVASGTMLVRARRRKLTLQVVSGVVLAVFLILHTGAALYTHHVFGLETDFYWAAGSLHYDPIRYGFAIYYFVAVLAFFVHLAAALNARFAIGRRWLPRVLALFGAVVAAVIIAAFAGVFYPVTISPAAEHYYQTNFGIFGVGQ